MRLLFFFLLLFPLSSLAKTILVLGDSLSEGYGVPKDKIYTTIVENKLHEAGFKDWKILNASISGSTSASALARLKWQLKNKPDFLILALGANDGLRGLSTEELQKNLAATIELAQKEKIKILFCGIFVPPNYGDPYQKKFSAVFPFLAKKYKLHFLPFLLDQVAGVKSLNQGDGIHPNEKGHAVMAETVFKALKGLL